MALPGKMCLGILEEDNPLKSYFCFKPLLIEENGTYVPFDSREAYPENGCVRIVPDKNESSHFKARMRQIGHFACVDLRDHPNENDKIRQNKNYHGDDSERNAHIIYSDVVREPSCVDIFALLKLVPEAAENAPLQEAPCAQRVLLCPEDAVLEDVYTWEIGENDDVPRLRAAGEKIDPGKLQVFELTGYGDRKLWFAVAPAPKEEAPEPVPAPPEKKREPEPVVEEKKEPEPAEKPWIARTEFVQPRVDPRLPPYERALAEQSGINPKRGRSLQEVIDDKWKRSRLEQLGHAVPSLSTEGSVDSPAEQALAALRRVWERKDQRQKLVDAIAELEGAQIALEARRTAIKESAVNEQLNDLEAQRLKMLGDLETLKRGGDEVRAELKKEIRRDEAEAFADAVQKTQQAVAEKERWEAEAGQARAAAQGVEDALNALADGRFEERLRDFALNSNALEMLRRLDAPKEVRVEPAGETATAEELVHRLRACCQDAGCPISHTDAVNLLVCASQGFLMISGVQGSGKTTLVRLLARALGAEDRICLIPPDGEVPEREGEGNVLSVILLDDANLATSKDLLRGLWPAGEDTLLCAAVQDGGDPLPAYLLGRSFLIRLAEEPADAPWAPKKAAPAKKYPPMAAGALQRAFEPKLTALPVVVTKRMEKLRADLGLMGVKLSRGTLNALWHYCAAAIPLMPLEPCAVLDLALAQRAVPAILASAPLEVLKALPRILADMPRCRALLDQPLPVEI